MNWVAVKFPAVLVTLLALTSVIALAKEGNVDPNTQTNARMTIEKQPSSKLPIGNHHHHHHHQTSLVGGKQESSREERSRTEAAMTIMRQDSKVNGTKDGTDLGTTSLGGKEDQLNRSWIRRRRRRRMSGEDSVDYGDRFAREDPTSPAPSEKDGTTASGKPKLPRWKVYLAAAGVAIVMLAVGYKKRKQVRRLIFGDESVDRDEAIDLPPEEGDEYYPEAEAGAVDTVAHTESKKTPKQKGKTADKKADKTAEKKVEKKKLVEKKKPGSPKQK